MTTDYPKNWERTTIRHTCEPTKVWNPQKEARDEFWYVDVSAVDRNSLAIRQPQRVKADEAPSRARKIIHAGDTIFATVRPTLRRVAFVGKEFDDQIASTAFCVLRPNRKAIPRFLYYILQTDQLNEEIAKFQSGASYPAVNDKDVLDRTISLPPRPEQEKITAVLWKIQHAIETEDKLIAAARELKQSAIRQLFTRGLRDELQKETEIGLIPKAWEVKRIGDISILKGGKRLPKGEALVSENTNFPYIRVTDMGDNSVDTRGIKFVPKHIQPTIARYIITTKDVYISIAGTIGLVGIIPPELEGANLTENAARIVLTDNEMDARFLMHFLETPPAQDQIRFHTAKNAQPKLALTRIEQVLLPKPDTLKEQREIANILDTIQRKIIVHEHKRVTLQELFKTVLHQLMNAEIRVIELDIDVSEIQS